MKTVFIKTLGCKVNTFDSQALANQFQQTGYQLLNSEEEKPDITVINSCSVTEASEKEARYLLRRYNRNNPSGIRIMTGCYAQIHSASIMEMPEVDFVVPNEAKERLVDIIAEKLQTTGLKNLQTKMPEGLQPVRDNKQGHFKSSLTLFDKPVSTRTRAFVKIQDGCNGFCSYCQIPYARGASRSVAETRVLQVIDELLAQGTQEIVLTGIHIGDYGEDLGAVSLASLVKEILPKPLLRRLRISSLEPSEVSEALLQALAQFPDKVCDHFHLPLQSGDDAILKLMRRQYNRAEYLQSVEKIRSYFPMAQISADVICGFPQEDEERFQNTLEFIQTCDLHNIHVFPYSKRPNTSAAKLTGHISQEVVKERAQKLRTMASALLENYCKEFMNTEHDVLWENTRDKQGRALGKTKNYLNVVTKDLDVLEGRISESKVILKGFVDKNVFLGVLSNGEKP